MQRWRCNQPRLLLSPPYLRLAYPLEIPSLSTSAFRRASFHPTPKFCLPSLQRTTYRRKWTSFAASQVSEDNTPSSEGSWNTVSANRKSASTARPRSELITVGLPGTLTPKLPLYDLLSTVIAAANLSPKTSAEVTLQAKPAQSLVFLKTHSPLTAHLLLSLTSLELNGTPITIKPYAPSPPISCLGVIHNVGGHFTTSQLLHDLESFTSDILAARMMGSTESVVMTGTAGRWLAGDAHRRGGETLSTSCRNAGCVCVRRRKRTSTSLGHTACV
ncbi:hypothetical protein HPB51_019247 [Rhipicephalus microplus]|uniref:Uncharacterized protein n=1 Tax=Rhipicephalus microplus TaxID=6941 RepID=A0A9J6F510_RHIMP|nr:hypothetical protein HPB51_019247 [Rhipicephalus microplus]